MESVHLLGQARTSSHRAVSCSATHSHPQQLHPAQLGVAPLASSGPATGPLLGSRGGQGARALHAARPHNQRCAVVASALFSPPAFQPDKLTVFYLANDGSCSDQQHRSAAVASSSAATQTRTGAPTGRLQRRYTLTHNDLTGALKLTVGERFNQAQISGFYTRLLRDEVVAEWRTCSTSGQHSLHVYCHVSGEERWLAPPQLRNYIFRRELPLVLDTFLYADRELLQQQPELASAEVFVHFQSCREELDVVERWGILGQRSTWQPVPRGLLQRLIEPVLGIEHQEQQQGREEAAPPGPPSMLLQPLSTGAGSASSSNSGACLCSGQEGGAQEQELLASSAAAVACQCGSAEGLHAGADSSTSRPAAEAGPVGATSHHQHRRRRKPQQQSTVGVALLQQSALQVPTATQPQAQQQQEQQQQEEQQGPAVAPAASWAAGDLSPASHQGPQGVDGEQAASPPAATSSNSSNRGGGGGNDSSTARQAWQQPVDVASPLGTALQEQRGLVVAVPVPVPVEVASGFMVLDRLAAVPLPVPVAAGTASVAVGGRIATPVGR